MRLLRAFSLLALPSLAHTSFASLLASLDPAALEEAALCAAQTGATPALSDRCAATLDELAAAGAALPPLPSGGSANVTALLAELLAGGGAFADTAALTDFCARPASGTSCAQELDASVTAYMSALGASPGTQPGCSAAAGSAAAADVAVSVSLVTGATCLSDPAHGDVLCPVAVARALNASGLTAVLLDWLDGDGQGTVPDPAALCTALAASGCCAQSLVQGAAAAIALSCAPNAATLASTLAYLPLLCMTQGLPLAPACPGFVIPSVAPPTADVCADLAALSGGGGCTLPAHQCPASACDLYCDLGPQGPAPPGGYSPRPPFPPHPSHPPPYPSPRPSHPPPSPVPGAAPRQPPSGSPPPNHTGPVIGSLLAVGAVGGALFVANRGGHLEGLKASARGALGRLGRRVQPGHLELLDDIDHDDDAFAYTPVDAPLLGK